MNLWTANSANSFITKLERGKNQRIAPQHLLTHVPQKKTALMTEMRSIPRHQSCLTPLTWAQMLPSQHPRPPCYPPSSTSSATIQTSPPSTTQPQHSAHGVTFKFRPANQAALLKPPCHRAHKTRQLPGPRKITPGSSSYRATQ